ncbi:hypothetical protein [Tenacibaculum agarivorans]|uniref:hypothetical protein n=1 Tax=Tenacibaculum agarivorans TaxID=1908389 RepID=UPI0013562937|nr:hypothetical protein [Tenacibaculum agarivorans]
MKNLRKIILLFLLIFLTGIIIAAVSINTTLDKKETSTSLTSKQDITYLIKLSNF